MSSPDDFSLRRIAVAAYGPTILYGLAEGAVLPVIPLSALALGASVPATALLVTLIGIGSMLTNLPASLITARHGERRALIAAALWCALAMVLCAVARHEAWLAVGCLMVGMAQAVFSLARQSYLADAVPVSYRARAMSTMGGSQRVGAFIGPFLAAGAISLGGLGGAYAVAVVALLAAAVLSAGVPEPQARGDAGAALGGPMAASGPGLMETLMAYRHVYATVGVGVFLVNGVRAARQVAIPLWADHLGLTAATTSVIYGIAGAIDLALFYPAGKAMDHWGRRAVVLPSLVLMGAATLALPWTYDATTLLIAAVVFGIGNGIGSGMVMTLGADLSPREGRPHFLGGWRLMADVGATCMPGLISLLSATLTLGAGIAAVGVAAFVAAAQLGWWIPRVRRGPGGASGRVGDRGPGGGRP